MSRSRLTQLLFGNCPSTTKVRKPRLGVETLEVREVPAFGLPDYVSGLASITAPEQVKAGQWVTIGVTNGAGADISMSWADPDEVYVDGVRVPSGGGIATLYNFGYGGVPQPDPSGGAKVSLPAGTHSVKFHIEPDAPDETITITGEPGVSYGSWAAGPWVVVGGHFYGQPWSTAVPFEVDGTDQGNLKLAVSGLSKRGAKAEPGDEVTYRLTARSTRRDLTAFSLTTNIPAGATLVPNSFKGPAPTVSGSRITWTATAQQAGRTTFAVSFKVKVNPEDQLGSQRALGLTASASMTSVAKGSETRTAHHELKLVRATQISGKVKDLNLSFPQMNGVQTRSLDGARVRLLQGSRVLDVAETNGAGEYLVQAPRPGRYTLEVSALADRYYVSTEQLQPATEEIVQRMEVTIAPDRTEPFEADDLYLPVQVLNRTARLMQKLHDVRPQILGGFVNVIGEAVFPDFMRFGYDLDAVNRLVHKVHAAGPRQKFVGVYDGSGDKDLVNGLIRVNAFMETLALRLEVTLKHADTFAKALALLVSTNLIPALAATMPGKKLTQIEQVTKFTAINLKIVTLSTVIPWTLRTVFDTFKLSPSARDKISTIVFNVARYAFDRYTGQTVDDVLFEVIFTGIRTGATAGYLHATINGLFGVKGTQSVLNEAAWMAERRGYSGGTNETLAYMETLWGKVEDRARFVEGVAGNTQTVLNYARLITGLRDVYTGGSAATGTPVNPGEVGLIGRILDKMNQKIWPVTDSKAATKSQFFRGAFKATMVYLLPLYVLPIGLPVLELYTVDPMMEAIGRGSMSGPMDVEIDPPPSTSFEELFATLGKWMLDAATATLVL